MAHRSLLLLTTTCVALAACGGRPRQSAGTATGAACKKASAGVTTRAGAPSRGPDPAGTAGRARPEHAPASAHLPGLGFSGGLPDLPPDGPLLGSMDLDGDAQPDPFSARWHGGSGFGGLRLRLSSSRLGARFTLESFGSFGHFLGALRLPARLAEAPPLVRGLVSLLYGESHLRQLRHDGAALPAALPATPAAADGSLEWLVERWLFPPLGPQAPFAERRWYRPHWIPGRPALPPSQVALLHGRLTWRLVRALHARDDAPLAQVPERPTGAPLALLAYHAHHHGALGPAGQCGAWTLYATAHGLVVYDATRNASSWAFVSDDVQKLRWPSLVRAACHDGLVVLERDDRQSVELVVIDPVAGRLGSLPLRRGAAWRLDGPGGRLEVDRAQHTLTQLRRALLPPAAWQTAYDLDGDGLADPIGVSFTGGAHCCYRLTLRSTRRRKDFPLPFALDGGFVGGLDLSQPARFHLADYDGDGLPDLYLEIETTNGHPQPLPAAWRRRHGLRTHHVVIGLRGGHLAMRDLE